MKRTGKRMLSVLVALMMLLALLPTTALADNDGNSSDDDSSAETTTYVAQIGEIQYPTLSEAISAAEDGDTVTLLNDTEITSTTIDKGITLDLGNKTLTIAYVSGGAAVGLYFTAGESTIRNGTILDGRIFRETSPGSYNVGAGYITVAATGSTTSLTTSNVTIETYCPLNRVFANPGYNYILWGQLGAALTVNDGTVLQDLMHTIDDGKYETYGGIGVTVQGNTTNHTSLTVNSGATISTTGFAISGNGTNHGTEITINEGAVVTSSASTGIYHPQDGTLTINGGEITGVTGIEIRAGELNMSGGTVTGTGSPTEVEANGNGTTSLGAGIAVAQHTTKLPITVNITGGSVSGYSALYESNPQKNGEKDIEKVNINIIDGKFESTNSNDNPQVVYSENKTGFITGGTFSDDVDDKYLPSGMNTVETDDGSYTIGIKDDAEAQIGSVAYATLAEAIDAAKDGDIITLLNDVTVSVPEGTSEGNGAINITKNITIDGGNHSITAGSGYTYSESSKRGEYHVINIMGSANVTIKNLSIDGESETKNSVPRSGINIYADTNSVPTVELENVTVQNCSTYGVTVGGGSLTATNLNTSGNTWGGVNVDTKNGVDASFTMNSGVINEKNAVCFENGGNANVTATINDGIFNGYVSVATSASNVIPTVKGGTFSNSVAKYVIASLNYEANNNGTYTYHTTLEEALATGGEVKSIAAAKGEESDAITVTLVNGSSETKIEVAANETIALPTFTRSGYWYFQGWSDGTTTYKGGTEVKITAATTFTAQWVYIPPVNPNPANSITTNSTTNGALSVNPSSASENTTVTITVTPDKDYELASLTVVDANGNRVSVKQVSENKFTFTMPDSKVTVSASFSKVVKELPFTDVSVNDYFYDAVVWAVENGVTYGNTATTFGVGVTCNRADAVTFIWRAYGCPAPKNRENPFTDVADSAYYADAVLWAVENGITVGTSATTFSPLESCRREHIVTFLYRAAGSPTVSHSSGFTDVADSAYYANAVTWAAQEGITVGAGSATTFGPTQNCYREQIVTFLYRNLAE